MMLLQIAVWICAGLCFLFLWDRLRMMSLRTHQVSVVLMHAGLALACLMALATPMGIANVAAVVASSGWLWTSLPTWSSGPPQHTESRPGELDVVAALFDRR